MIFQIQLGLGVLVLLFSWVYVHKKTAVDVFRNKMFRLRDEVRDYYAENSVPMDSPGYKAIRGLLNSYIYNAENISFSFSTKFRVELNNNPEIENYLIDKVEAPYRACEKETRDFLSDVRMRARSDCQLFVIQKSGIAMSLFLLIGAFLSVFEVCKRCFQIIQNHQGLIKEMAFMATLAVARQKAATKVVDKKRLEESSFALSSKNICNAA